MLPWVSVLYLANTGRSTPEVGARAPTWCGNPAGAVQRGGIAPGGRVAAAGVLSDQVQPSRYRGPCHRMRFVRNLSASELTGMGLLPESLEAMQPMPEVQPVTLRLGSGGSARLSYCRSNTTLTFSEPATAPPSSTKVLPSVDAV